MINIQELTNVSGIYLLRCKINQKIYIGKANKLRIRVFGHKNSPNKKDQSQPITRAISKYGWENFDVEILELVEDKMKLLDIEARWINIYNATDLNIGYNLLKRGGDKTNKKTSEETKKLMSSQRKGKGNGMYGKHHSEEAKELIGKKAKERGYKGEQNPMYGKTHTKETMEIIAAKHKQWRDNNPPGFLGKKHSEEAKKKMSDAAKQRKDRPRGINHPSYGKSPSEETQKKITYALSKPVKQIDITTNKIIKIWLSSREAATGLGKKSWSGSSISAVCRGEAKQSYGFKWESVTKEEYEKYKLETLINPS